MRGGAQRGENRCDLRVRRGRRWLCFASGAGKEVVVICERGGDWFVLLAAGTNTVGKPEPTQWLLLYAHRATNRVQAL